MPMTAGKLVQLYNANPDGYLDELDQLLGRTTDEEGFKCIRDPMFRPRQLSILDVGEAFVGRDALRKLYDNPFGRRGGHAVTTPPANWRFEEVGGGALGPSEFQAINVWLGTVDGLVGAELIDRYNLATMQARELVTWKMGVRVQENKLTRYGFATAPTDDIQPAQEFPSGDLAADWIRANRMRKQGEALAITWEAAHFDQTDSIMDAVSGENGLAIRFAVVIDERVQKAIWGIDNTYNRLGTVTNTYLTTGAYVNKIDNQLIAATTSIDAAEQALLAQTDPSTGLEVAPPEGERFLIVTPFKFLTASRLAAPFGEEVGTLSDTSRMQKAGPFYTGIKAYRNQRAVRLMVAGAGVTAAQANERWIWGNTKSAFQYRSAKDITTYRYTIQDSPALARKDVLMEIDCSEMGSTTVVEPRYVVLSKK